MPAWLLIIPAAMGVFIAIGYFIKRIIIPGSKAITEFTEGLPVMRDFIDLFKNNAAGRIAVEKFVEVFASNPNGLNVLSEISRQFRTDSGATLRDVVNRLEVAAIESAAADEAIRLAAIGLQDEVNKQTILREEDRRLAIEDRTKLILLLAALERVNVKTTEGVTIASSVAQDLEAAHKRAEAEPTTAPGEAADAAMLRPIHEQ